MVGVQDDPLLRNVAKNVSSQTFKAYTERLDRLVRETGKPLLEMVRDAKRSNEVLQEMYESTTTRRNVIDAVISLFLHNPRLPKDEEKAYEAWSRKQRVLRALVQKARDNNRMTPELKAKHIDLVETREIASKLHDVIIGKKEADDSLRRLSKERLSQDYLIMLLMIDVPPKRADFGKLVVIRPPKALPKSGNYVVVPKAGAVTLVMHDYKTAKFYKKFEEELPGNVSDAIRESLKMFPRAHVFTGPDGHPMKDKAYSEMVKRVFLRHTGKPAGINALRHAYITHMADHGKVTLGELKVMAKSMGHSTGMQNGYQLVEGGGSKA